MASRRRVIIPVTVAAVLVVAAGGVGAYAAVRGPDGDYRTAVAGMRPVNATLQATGTVQPASSATVSFPISGTVATVPVSVGSTVSAGSVLATVDGTALSSALAQAKSTLAEAKLTLEQDRNGGSSSSSASPPRRPG